MLLQDFYRILNIIKTYIDNKIIQLCQLIDDQFYNKKDTDLLIQEINKKIPKVRQFIITKELYENDSHMIIPYNNLSNEMKKVWPSDTDYDPREDPYNNFIIVNEMPELYTPYYGENL